MMMTWKNFISFTGIFTYPIFAILFRFVLHNMTDDFTIPYVVQFIIVYIVPLIFPVVITTTNMERQKRGQTEFSFAEVYGLGNKDPKHSKEYLDAAYPDIPPQYSSKIPTGLVLGKHKGRYACCKLEKNGINIFGIGTFHTAFYGIKSTSAIFIFQVNNFKI